MTVKYKTKIQIRPSDIDLNGHVNNAVYLDYILFARMDQMDKDYHYSMDKFLEKAMSWVVKTIHVDYLRPILLDDEVYVYTWTIEMVKKDCRIGVEIVKLNKNGKEKSVLEGYLDYALIDIHTGRSIPIPDDVIETYTKNEPNVE